MRIVTTPMCEEIVKLAGCDNYIVNKHPDEENADLAILLSESKVKMPSLPIKLNTPNQIFESIKKVSEKINNNLDDDEIYKFFNNYPLAIKYLNNNFKRNINVKVLSNFLTDIASDMGFNIDDVNYNYLIYPDYLKNKVIDENVKIIEIPTHNAISRNPFERVELRYSILEKLI